MNFFHPSYTIFFQFLAQFANENGLTLKQDSGDPLEFRFLDSGNRHLLEAGLVLREQQKVCALEDSEGEVRWQGSSDATAELYEHIEGLLDGWLLVPVAKVSGTRHRIAVCDAETESITVLVQELQLESSQGSFYHGVVLSVESLESYAHQAKRFLRLLRENGGVACPNPFLILSRKAAIEEGWRDEQHLWTGKNQWGDALQVLVGLLRGVRDNQDPAFIRETRVLLGRLRTLLRVGAIAAGRKPSATRIGFLDELHATLGTLENLDRLVAFLAHEQQALSPEWVGVPGVFSLCDGWTPAHAVALQTDLASLRAEEQERIRISIPAIASPESVLELSAAWPDVPRLEKTDSEYRGRLELWLSTRIKVLQTAIGDLSEAENTVNQWLVLRRRCRKIYRMMDLCPVLKKRDELRFLRRMVRLWHKRLGDLEDMVSSAEMLEDLSARLNTPVSFDAAHRLARAMREWVDLIRPHLHKTVPALALAARNARKKIG